MSASYERMNYITSFGFSIRWRRQFLRQLGRDENKLEIADLLTGMGETWSSIKKNFPNSTITALDFSDKMLNHARNKSKRRYDDQVKLVKENVLQNSLPGNHFDVVVCAFGLKTFNEQQLRVLASETRRILKEGGQFCFLEISKPGNRILHILYSFYLGKMIPLLGRLFLGNPSEYKMLWRYTDNFGNSQKATEIFRNEGLNPVYNSYFFGCATGFSGRKLKSF